MSPIPLHAGPLQLALLPGEGSVRYIFAGGREVLRGIGAPVRDQAWATIPAEISDLKIDQQINSFRVTFTARCRAHPVDFRWHGELTGSPQGTLIFDFDGEALEDFYRNRIGFCVLHPAEIAGTPCVIEHTDGHKESSCFPQLIQTGVPFADIRAISHEVASGVKIEVRMEGDTFETEDQRNWTDASFKTYCTPLSLPKPVLIFKGTHIQQRVTVRLLGTLSPVPENFIPPWRTPAETTVSIGRTLDWKMPAIGTIWNAAEPADEVIAALQPLSLAYLRVDLWLNDRTHFQKLTSAASAAAKLASSLELAVFVDDRASAQLASLQRELQKISPIPKISRWLIFHEGCDATPAAAITAAREIFEGSLFAAPIGGGSTDNFTELNYNPAVAQLADFTVHACNPQVHAFDESSITETLSIQGLTAAGARHLSAGRPVVISPVTFTRRWRLTDSGAPTGLPAGLMPFQTDPRQSGNFVAAWTVGSTAALAREGVASATYFEAIGANGLLSPQGRPLPVATGLALLASRRGASVVDTASGHPLSIATLALDHDGQRVLILANLRNAPLCVHVAGTWGERIMALSPHGITSTLFP